MVRWEPGARERLQMAAMELYSTRGFERTTAAEIAAAVGLTERTFFRYFTDKREVLFGGQDQLQQLFVDGVAAAPESAAPLDLVRASLAAASPYFPPERREFSRLRHRVISANPALLEREQLKRSTLAIALAEAIRARGVAEPAASLAGETAASVFHIAFAAWIAPGEKRTMAAIAEDTIAALAALSA